MGARVEHIWPLQSQRIVIGNIGIDTHSKSSLIAEVLDHALRGSGTRQIVTVNAQIYVLADKSSRYRGCLGSADYLCADGMSVVWACNHLAGASVPRIAGVDLIEDICERGAADRLSIFLLGGRPDNAKRTAARLERLHPGLKIAGVSCPKWGFETREETLTPVLEQIANAKPHIVFVALGAPKQEYLIDEFIRPLGVPIAVVGVGGSFEILSGSVNRAPLWMQSIGLEWVFRLCEDPRRLWRRYLIGNAEFVWSVAKWKLQTLSPNRGTLKEKVAR